MKIVLAGNPNVGKSSLFNLLTGAYAEVSNYPGTTVDYTRGRMGRHMVFDTPGIYGISSFSADERAARRLILSADVVINVVDVTRLSRDLFLTLQLIDMGIPMIVCLNMMDELSGEGAVDIQYLEKQLGVPVVPICARLRKGAERVATLIPKAARGKKTPGIELLLKRHKGVPEPIALLALEDDPQTLSEYCLSSGGQREKVYRLRRKYADKIATEALSPARGKSGMAEALGALMLRPVWGVMITLLILASVFYIVGIVVSGLLSDYVHSVMLSLWPGPQIARLTLRFYSPDSFFYQILAGRFGLLTHLPAYIFGLLVPLIASFYFLLAILEDSGILPRMAAVSDWAFTKIGLNGRAAIPMVLGFGCVTAAIISTRALGTRREQLIATTLLGLTVPCSAQTAIIIGMLAPLGVGYLAAYGIIILFIFTMIGTVLNRLLSGKSEPLIIDLPKIRRPQIKNVLKKTFGKTTGFIKEATPFFAAGLLLLAVLDTTGGLNRLTEFLSPLITGLLRLPGDASASFLLGMIRRDFGAVGLLGLNMTPLQVLTASVTLTLFVPCIASVITLFMERRAREALAIWAGSILLALSCGTLIAFFGGMLG